MTIITTEERHKIYHTAALNSGLTTQALRELGFSKKRIETLLKYNIITRRKTGIYDLWSTGDLYLYSVEELLKGHTDEAVHCYEYYYKLYPFDRMANHAMFFACIFRHDYKDIEKYLDKAIIMVDGRIQNREFCFYLYLLSFVITLPEKYRVLVESMTYEDIKMSDINKDKSLAPLRVMAYYHQNFVNMTYYLADSSVLTYGSIITSELVNQARIRQSKVSRQIRELTKNGEYGALASLLDEEKRSHRLKPAWKAIRTLAIDIISMQESHIPSIPLKEETNDLFRMIQLKDYESAFAINNYFDVSKGRKKKGEIDVLLKKALELRAEYWNNAKLATPPTDIEHEIVPIGEMVTAFLNEEPEMGLEFLKAIINMKGLHEYSYLLVDHIKICLSEYDNALIKPLSILSKLSIAPIKIDIDEYIASFENFLLAHRFTAAKLCLHIIAKACSYGHADKSYGEMKDILNKLYSKLDRKRREVKTYYITEQ